VILDHHLDHHTGQERQAETRADRDPADIDGEMAARGGTRRDPSCFENLVPLVNDAVPETTSSSFRSQKAHA
jgi:hypothetical protein